MPKTQKKNKLNSEQFLENYNWYLSKLRECKIKKIPYRIASKNILPKIINSEMFSSCYDGNHRLDKTIFSWKYERPPIRWYAAALASLYLNLKISYENLCEIAKACNYFGDFELSIELTNFILLNSCNHDKELTFQTIKQLAKAYKNIGDFEKSRVTLRNAFKEFENEFDTGRIAYLYLLFAKLCNDYQQRKGWHQEFHEIARNKMLSCKKAPAVWREICEESYAKSLPYSKFNNAISIYENILSKSSKDSDQYVRIKSHYLELKIFYNLINSKLSDPHKLLNEFDKHLNEYWETIQIAEKIGNIKAEIVRKGHILRIARKIELWRCSMPSLNNRSIDIIDDFINGEAISIANQVASTAFLINDWRTSASIYFEKGMWYEYILSGPNSDYKNQNKINAQECFNEARLILKKPNQTLTFLYHLVLMELGTSYAFQGKWYQSLDVLKECYLHCKELARNLRIDEEHVQTYSNESVDNLDMSELSLLETDEKNKLSKALMEDYKVLTSRLMKIGEKLSNVSLEQITKWTAHLYANSWRSRHHSLLSIINNFRGKLINQPEIIAELENIKYLVNKWNQEDSSFLKISEFDLISETSNYVKSDMYLSKFESNIIIDSNNSQQFKISFTIEVLRLILSNLISNTCEHAQKKSVDWRVQIRYKIIHNYISLIFEDNTGDFKNFLNVIKKINIYEKPTSLKGPDHGNGLIIVKEIIRDVGEHSKPWRLEKKSDWKMLIIPLIEKDFGSS